MVLEPDQVALLGAYVLVGMVVGALAVGGWPAVRAQPARRSPLASVAGLAAIAAAADLTWLFAEATTRPEVDLDRSRRAARCIRPRC